MPTSIAGEGPLELGTRRHANGLTRWARRLGVGVLSVGLALAGLFLVANLTTEYSYWSRIVAWRDAGFSDFTTKFAARPIPNGPIAYQFRPTPATTPPYLASVTYARDGHDVTTRLDPFLAGSETTAFLVIQGDRLLYEGYFNGSSRTSTQTSFSTAKSFGSALIGIAIDEGYIHSIDDPITRYLPELASHPGLDRVTIRHLLAMSSGLDYNGTGSGGGLFGDDARTYYHPDLRALALGVRAGVSPGSRWQYNNYHPLLLGMILERATGRPVSTYLSEKLWQPLGMEAPGSWSLDSVHDGFEKMESGLNGRAIDFAKFGALYLQAGTWQGRQLVPRAWVEASTHPDPTMPTPATSPPGEEWARSVGYGYEWWVDPRASGRFYAAGNFGQFIYVAPDRDAVLVRFGSGYGGADSATWLGVLRDLASRLP
jgi:CubicO group peptidase (beta-lactamase class C family)